MISRANLERFLLGLNPVTTVVGTDFDGTISVRAEEPNQARVNPVAFKALHDLSALTPVVVISGRDSPFLVRQLCNPGEPAEFDLMAEFGTEVVPRGSRSRHVSPVFARFVSGVTKYLADQGIHGISFSFDPEWENFVLHFDDEDAVNKIDASLRSFIKSTDLYCAPGTYWDGSIRIHNLRDKGWALEGFVDQHPQARDVIFLGDDSWDIEAFKALRRLEAQGMNTLAVLVQSGATLRHLVQGAEKAKDVLLLRNVDASARFLSGLAELLSVKRDLRDAAHVLEPIFGELADAV